MKRYTRLTQDERWQIQVHRKSGKSFTWIGKELGRSDSTIRREWKRNSTAKGYRAPQAQRMAVNRHTYRNQQRRKLVGATWDWVLDKVRQRWSPVQISGRLQEEFGIAVSHETIYQRIWKLGDRQAQGIQLHRYLRHGGRKYQRRDRQKYAGRGYIPGRVDIDERPDIVEQKGRIGDWELDTIVGKNHQGYLVSLVDRHSKYTRLVRVANAKAETVKTAILAALQHLKDKVFTLTADNGKEFSLHQDMAIALESPFFFAKPYHSWQRGLNEHTNGLVRQFFPKATHFLAVTDEEVARVEKSLNNRPRKILNFRTPHEVFYGIPLPPRHCGLEWALFSR
jgi:transposase, IS30 family